MDPLCKAVKSSENEGKHYIFLEGTLEGMTQQLMRNNGEMLQVSNESETFFNKLYSVKGKVMKQLTIRRHKV
jgi:deoxyadenosine/deoxycytidine kinase